MQRKALKFVTYVQGPFLGVHVPLENHEEINRKIAKKKNTVYWTV